MTDGAIHRSDPPPRPPIGRVGAYELLLELASGGMATVYLARGVEGPDQGQLVAVKRPHRHLANDRAFMNMLLDEARLASRLDHPNVVRVRELGYEAEEPFLVFDYVEGVSLSELRKQLAAAERAVDTRVAVRVVLDALAGLHAAHELTDDAGKPIGLIHRDVSPHNVLLRCDGRAQLTDFGIAKAEDRVQTTRTHEVKGKLAYLAPERVDKRRTCTKQSDVFSMGVVLWECLAGRRLFRGDEALETIQQVASMPIPRLRRLGAEIPEALDEAIARSLSRDLETRYPTAAAFADAIVRAAGPDLVGRPEDVARVVEAIFAPRLQKRHDELRAILGTVRAERALGATGLAARPSAPADIEPGTAILSAVSPPAPSERYVFDQGLPVVEGPPPKRRAWHVVGGAIASIVVAGLALVVLMRGGVAAGEQEREGATPAGPSETTTTEPTSLPRRVVVPLPFVASKVTFDDESRALSPPADVAAFDVRAGSGLRHRVVAVAADGSEAEGFVREQEGVARAEDPGFAVTHPEPTAEPVMELEPTPAPSARVEAKEPPRRAPHHHVPSPVSTTADGFHKVR